MTAINDKVGRANIKGELLLYITPPKEPSILDSYFKLGADRVACSIEVWDEKLANIITPGKVKFTSRQRHLDALSYAAEKYGAGKSFSNTGRPNGIHTDAVGMIPLEARYSAPSMRLS